jgi:hypothetical protein
VVKKIYKKPASSSDLVFSIDSPKKIMNETKSIRVEGWAFSKKSETINVRILNNNKEYKPKLGLKRPDVAKAYPEFEEAVTLKSGFSIDILFEEGFIAIEVQNGQGNYSRIYKNDIKYGTEKLPKDLYNKELTNNYPEHVNLIENRKAFYYEPSIESTYERGENDARLVATYLPQFHPIRENDITWGKGFTEWTNVASAQPRFIGHQQPILPADLGYYDLRLESNIEAQIELAKSKGVYGFCFYYYWFSGKKILDTPLNSLLAHKEWDFNFTICWANENWTKRWDGRDQDVIIAQEYLEDDPLSFIKDVEHILLDKRYIKEDGKPVLMVYRASELKEPSKYADTWREYFRAKHGLELQLVSFLSFEDKDPREYGFDAALDFAPLSMGSF